MPIVACETRGGESMVFSGYLIGGLLMLAAAVVALVLGLSAEQKSLEQIAELDPVSL